MIYFSVSNNLDIEIWKADLKERQIKWKLHISQLDFFTTETENLLESNEIVRQTRISSQNVLHEIFWSVPFNIELISITYHHFPDISHFNKPSSEIRFFAQDPIKEENIRFLILGIGPEKLYDWLRKPIDVQDYF